MSGIHKILIATVILFAWSCQEDEHPFSEVPEISLVSMSHDTIVEFDDVEVITIQYKDGNGDLGFVEPDKYAIFIRDLRLDEFDGFYVGPLAPLDAEVAIQGQINVEFPNLFIFGNRNSEKTRFEIKMKDRSGNESNLIMTEEVVIIKK